MSEKIKISKRHLLSKKEIKEVRDQILKEYPNLPMEWDKVEIAVYQDISFYLDNNFPCIVKKGDLIFPTLLCLLKRDNSWMNGVIIDRGATNAVSRGADLMLPGIKGVRGEFKEKSIIAAYDQDKGVPVMIGRSLYNSKEISDLIKQKAKGKAIENLHYSGDLIWKISVSL
ncbi:PUA-domain protein [Caldisphaera lagunensis DSM 15908]|uniref:PUA-domain protein n=1 Tax=Caldisphaera lagunensis (strain DSM 15908 / JCM 11604 / ANMR 0165 / IC-154) TaxID=1056495 RepID=L0AAL2_CALLD|nr:DUF1947 domain-containing protein [Caldisphaera lagunensis]AFZ70137.1 PUA-domain protein [Caldisphaera lagunensis DSM 15908]